MAIHINPDSNQNSTIHIRPNTIPSQSISVESTNEPNPTLGTNPVYGPTGNGISSISKTSTSGVTDTYTIYYTNGTTTTFNVVNGDSIASIILTDTSGLVDTYTITLDSGATYPFTVTNGEKGDTGDTGATGATGNGIASIEKTGTSGLVDTYTITYTNGDTNTFTVTNGQDGDDGYSPTATVTKSGDTATITITDVNGTTTATVTDGSDAEVTSTNVINALGYTPYDSSNPDGYTTNVGTVTSVNNETPDTNGNVTIEIPDTATWGNITGTLSDQTDLSGELTSIQGDIDDIEDLIPSQATTSNQLADKSFVNSSVSTNTAYFIGTFNSVAELEAYSGALTNNDYAFVVSTDSAGNTVYNRYKYSTATTPASWSFEYALNNSSFTSDQWAAINSGITSSDVTLIGTALQPSAITNMVTTNTAQDITATKTFVGNSWNNELIAKRSGTNGSFIAFENTSGILGGIGIAPDNRPISANQSGSLSAIVRSGTYASSGTGSSSQPVYINSDGVAQAITDMATTDTAQTISATKTFTARPEISTNANDKMYIKDTRQDKSAAPSSQYSNTLLFRDKNNLTTGYLTCQQLSGGAIRTAISAQNYKTGTTTNVNGVISVTSDKDGSITTAAPTPDTSDNSTQIATTEFVKNQGYITSIDSTDVTTALGYTPYDSSNPSGYTTNVGTVTSVNNVSPVNGNVTLSIPEAQIQSDWGQSDNTKVDYIKNKPTLGTMAAESASDYTPTVSLATVATSGSYNDLSNKPTIPTSSDYWTVGTQGGTDSQTTYSKKLIYYKQNGAQDNGFRMIGDSDQSAVSTTGAWTGRCLIGNEKRTFLLGTARNSASSTQSICGIGAHTWGSATSQTSAGWDNIYIQPDGSTATYIGGNGWRGSSGWFRVSNNNSGSAAYRVEINTGSNSSTSWKKILPNNATGTSAVLFSPTVGTTNAYSYSTAVNGNVSANYGTSYGYDSSAAGNAVGIGASAKATGSYSIQIGQGTNSTANTLSVGLSSSLNVQLLDSSGKIPDDRINTTIARTSDIPDDTNDLTNGAGFVTATYDSTNEMLILA